MVDPKYQSKSNSSHDLNNGPLLGIWIANNLVYPDVSLIQIPLYSAILGLNRHYHCKTFLLSRRGGCTLVILVLNRHFHCQTFENRRAWWISASFTYFCLPFQSVMRGEMTLDPYITHTFEGLEGVNASIEALHSGSCLRAVVHIGKNELPPLRLPTLKGDVKVEGGRLKQVLTLFLNPLWKMINKNSQL